MTDLNRIGHILPSPQHVKEDVQLMVDNVRRKPTCVHPNVLNDPTMSRFGTDFDVNVDTQQQNAMKPAKNFMKKSTAATSESDYIKALDSKVPTSPSPTNPKQPNVLEEKKDKDFIFDFNLDLYTTATTAAPTATLTQTISIIDVKADKVGEKKEQGEEYFKSMADLVSPPKGAASQQSNSDNDPDYVLAADSTSYPTPSPTQVAADITVVPTAAPTVLPTISSAITPTVASTKDNDPDQRAKKRKEEENIFFDSVADLLSLSREKESMSSSSSSSSSMTTTTTAPASMDTHNEVKKYTDDYFVDVPFDDEITPLRPRPQLSASNPDVSVATTSTTSSFTPSPSMPTEVTVAPNNPDPDPDYVQAADSTSHST